MALGVYKVPKPFKDEDKWLRFFTKTQLLALTAAIAIGISLIAFFAKLGMVVIGIILFLLVVVSTAVCFMIDMPPDKYLIGGGEKIITIVIRIVVKKLFNRVLYVKNILKGEM